MRRLHESFNLANGVPIPKLGFGTWLLEDKKQCIDSVTYALKNGYTHIDTATDYYNEKNEIVESKANILYFVTFFTSIVFIIIIYATIPCGPLTPLLPSFNICYPLV